MNCYPFIEAEKECRRKRQGACELLKVSRATFCQYLRGPSLRERQDAELAGQIRTVHAESKGRYGVPWDPAELRRGASRIPASGPNLREPRRASKEALER